jgi:hypothetical protein
MRLRLVLIVAVIAALGWLGGSRALADSGAAKFIYEIGAGNTACCPDTAMASNGDTITVTGTGTLSIHPKSVTGGGKFTHKNAAGTVLASGTWAATQLLSFNSYGTSPGFPPGFEGGLALIRVRLMPKGTTSTFDAVLQVNCLIGKVPAGAKEGIRLAVQDGLNFNKEVPGGETLFIRQ